MKSYFADTQYWVAVTRPGDQWRVRAHRAVKTFGPFRIVTTEEVLIEFLAALSKQPSGRASSSLRMKAAKMVRTILDDPQVEVTPQSHESFIGGLALFEKRSDKQYSLTDCISMNAMRERKIPAILSNDHHFEQEAFTLLLTH